MPLDLPAARALHDRNPHSPLFCITCDGVDWPCPTAVALGATGQSEWDNDTAPLCAHGIPYTDACAACLTIAMARPLNDGTDRRCTLNHPHPGPCAILTDPDDPQCRTWGPDGHHWPTSEGANDRCRLARGHDGDHYWPILTDPDAPAPDYIPCGNTEGKYRQQPCILAEKHWDDHVDRDGNRWGQEPDA